MRHYLGMMIIFAAVGMNIQAFKISTDGSKLVDVTSYIPSIKTDIIYATDRNFTGTPIYKAAKCFLLKEVADSLAEVQKKLHEKGLGLLVWDAYRPLPAQQRLWDVCPDPRYVSPPDKGGKHTRGTTVDLTIITLADGKPLEMPTGFDDLSPKARYDYPDVSAEAKKNRALLREIMEQHNFKVIINEWWHFDYIGWQDYPVLNVDFDKLK